MKYRVLLSLILLLLIPNVLNAQWKRETGFTLGITSPDKRLNLLHGQSAIMMKMGVLQSWNNPTHRISFRPELGANIDIWKVNLSEGGNAGSSGYYGTIASINGELAAMAQIRVTKRLFCVFGPSYQYILTNIYKITHYAVWYGQYFGGESGSKTDEYQGHDRKYLKQPSIGIKAMLIRENISKKVSLGVVFNYQWKDSPENIFGFSRTSEISLYLGLH